MKYFPLIWATLWRKKTRPLFTLLSVIVAFLLFGMLETVDYAFSHPSTGVTGADKLITTNKYSITLPLPVTDAQQIRSVPGVAEVTWISWFGAYYQESKNFVFALPVDADSYFNLHRGEFIVSDEQMQAYRNTRTGALVNEALMKKFGWKVGDKVPLHSTIWTQKRDGSLDWTFDIVGTFSVKDTTQASAQSQTLLFHYDLFDEGRSFGDGVVLELVLAESLLLCVIAAIIGLALSFAALPIIKLGLQGVELSPRALIPGMGAAVLLALIVGLPPALRAMRLNIVDALADKR